MIPSGVSLLAELEGMATRLPKEAPKVVKPLIEIEEVLDFDEVFSLFKQKGLPNTARKVVQVLSTTGYSIVKLKEGK